MEQFNLDIIIPTRKYLSMKADTLIVNTADGERSFYAHMYDLICPLEISPLIIKYNGHIANFAIGGGTLEVSHKTNTITLLLNTIESLKEIDVIKAKQVIEEAEKLKLEAKTKRDIIEAERRILRSLNRLSVKNNYKDY